MVRSKGIVKLLSGILEEMHIQSSVEEERKKRENKMFHCYSVSDEMIQA